ncbi:hypothetical protein BKA69DRAFT_1170346 [Paraphysoderma sedebokerense]|nr:hypothetical protein BKA69DRAFT_1170346 [Paraphysoderma sedebokerense]
MGDSNADNPLLDKESSSPGRVYQTEGSVEIIVNKIRSHVYAMRIRIADSFRDFDKLRTGFITPSQFRRCLSQTVEKNVKLRDGDYDVLIKHYDIKQNGTVWWLGFVDTIEEVFGPRKLEKTPTKPVAPPHEILKLHRPVSPLSMTRMEDIMVRIRQYAVDHGCDVKSWYKDYDKHNTGYATVNQTKTVNYFKFNFDVNRKDRTNHQGLRFAKAEKNSEVKSYEVESRLMLFPQEMDKTEKRDDVEEKIQRGVYVKRIRLLDFFRDYDKHNVGLVTENQFRAGLNLSGLDIGVKELNLMMESYKNAQNLVNYRAFCTNIDSFFVKHELNDNPTAEVHLPTRDQLVKKSNDLSTADESRFREIIIELNENVRKRRLNMLPFFNDFDKKSGHIGQVTRSRFIRLLSTLDLKISNNDLSIILAKFEDKRSGHVNYKEFLRVIDPSVCLSGNSKKSDRIGEAPVIISEPNVRMIMENLIHAVTIKGIRVSEFFKDFDRLRSGNVSRNDFFRALNHMGLLLSHDECRILADTYEHPSLKNQCKWKDLEADVESASEQMNSIVKLPAVTIKHFEKVDQYIHSSNEPLPKEENISLLPSMMSLKGNTENTGLPVSPLLSLVPRVKVKQSKNKSLNDQELDNLLTRMKTKVKTERMRVKDFMRDYDHLSCGRISKNAFRRALALCEFGLTEPEWTALENRFICHTHPNMINYREFSDQMESVFTVKGLESKPTCEPNEFKTAWHGHGTQHVQEPHELEKVMRRLGEILRQRPVDLLRYLEDHDRIPHNGTITKSQFRSALSSAGINLREPEAQLIFSKYALDDYDEAIDYLSFNDHVLEMSKKVRKRNSIQANSGQLSLDKKSFETGI